MKGKRLWILLCLVLAAGFLGASARGRQQAPAGAMAAQETLAAAVDTRGNPTLLRLEELDEEIAASRGARQEQNAGSQKAAAEGEWSLWENEVQDILTGLEDTLDSRQRDRLMEQQQSWIRQREQEAVDASRQRSGGSMEQVRYYESLAELTRERAYELAEAYGEYLME